MAMENFTRHQQGIIKRYYENRDGIALQRVQELVTELYLAETAKKRDKIWDSLELHLGKLNIPSDRIAHLRKQNKPELVAQLIQSKV
jgi:hypothetical protein